MDSLLQDLRYAVRSLLKQPGVTAIAVAALALGIGVNTTVFSCVNALFLRPFPYRDPARLVQIVAANPSRGWDRSETSYPNFADWREQSRSFDGMLAYTGRSFNLGTAGADGEPERLEGEAVTADAFRILGLKPMLGRDFRADEDRPGAPGVAILSHALWQRRFGGDSAIVGKPLTLNGKAYTVIGVLPPPLQFPDDAQLWVPLALDPTRYRSNNFLEVIGRLRPGVTPGSADAELAAIAHRLEGLYPESNTGWTARAVPLREADVGEYKAVLAIMMGAVAFVLLIACANVANLLLARATARRREVAIRVALGAGRWRIVRQLLTESVLLALAGAGLGLLIALWGLDLIVAAVPADKPFWMVFTLDSRVLGFTLALALATGVLFGLAPALQAVKTDLNESLKEGTRGAAGGRHQRTRHALVVAEVALSVVLLVGATLMIRSFLELQYVDPGFNRHHLLEGTVVLAETRYDSTPRRTAFFQEVLRRLGNEPGVVGVTAVANAPLSGSSSHSTFTVEGMTFPLGAEPTANWTPATAGYGAVMEVPLLQGRDLSQADIDAAAQVVVVNRTLADRFWPGGDAVGRRIRFNNGADNPWMTVIGVVGDVKYRRLDRPAELGFYLPYSISPWRYMTIVARTAGDPAAMAPALRAAVHATDPQVPVFALMTLDDAYHSALWEKRLYGWMFGSFAAIALLLAAVGLYGVMSYMVSLRTHEIGVRMALGARSRDVQGLVVRRGLRLAGLGVLIGLAGAFAVTQLLRTLLFGVSATDPLTFIGIPAMLVAIAMLASYVPARRASRIDPLLALRYE